MEIEYIYSADDTRHKQLRNNIARHCRERGIMTWIRDQEASVSEPIVVVDGYPIACRCEQESANGRSTTPVPEELAELIEYRAWMG